uniref:Reverse transcriptase n=1 Tax=Fagus sylvatica TaxID=28930 RepID=A0A2N9FZS8_FAGSY
MTSTRSTTSEDRFAALEVGNHGLQRQLEEQRADISGIRDSLAALSESMAQLHRDNQTRGHRDEEDSVNQNRGNNGGNRNGGYNGGPNGGVQARFSRLDFPRFNGEDPTGWIYKADQFFRYQGTAEAERILLASFHLQDEALQWYQWYERTNPNVHWGEFTQALCVRFGPSEYEDFDEALSRLRQTTTVRDYQSQFERLAARVQNWPEKALIGCYIRWPPEDIRAEDFVTTAMKNSPLATDARRNSFTCWKPSLNLKRNSATISEETTEEISPPEISLHALTGISTPNTMRVCGMTNGKQVHILIDSGSTHNFVNSNFARKLECHSIIAPPFQVQVANGEALRCTAVYQTTVEIQGYQFTTHLFALDLQGSDVVLGMQWLRSLGRVLHDWENLTMDFTMAGQHYHLSGIPHKQLEHSSLHSMHKLLATGVDAFLMQLVATPTFSRTTHLSHERATELDQLLVQYQSVFQVPQALPPTRAHDHRINLEPGTGAINSRRKTAHGGFVLTTVLSTQATIKDRYPIPVIDELLDELHGAAFFTKLDLKSGYHQIRVQPADVPKTAFRTHDGHYEFSVMPFGLTNAPATFQSLMNDIFRPTLRQYVLVFFDDILVYSKTWGEHMHHLTHVFDQLLGNQLFVNKTKCLIGQQEVDYLGHIISPAGVSANPTKITSMTNWPTPRTTTALRGFLGLTGYYRKFVCNYGSIAAPLTKLLTKNGFKWSDSAEAAFHQLKTAMVQAPVLSLPDFNKLFVVEADASGYGLGAVLMQEHHPIAFYSKAISIRTDHRSLKYLLEQRITTMDQQRWIVKLMGYDYEILYRPGIDNKAADALSRVHGELAALSSPQHSWLTEINKEGRTHPEMLKLKTALSHSDKTASQFTLRDDLLWFQNRLVLPASSQFKTHLIREFHDTPVGGHSGVLRTYKRIAASFYWAGMKRDIHNYIRKCDVCQRNKYETMSPAGLLQPLPIPSQIWEDISMDFIDGLPNSCGFTVILVVVDRLSKYGHFLPLKHPYTVKSVAEIFIKEVSRLHGMPRSIVSDRDKVFTSQFWAEYFCLQGSELRMSSAYHPQTDGQTESLNKCLETYLRCFVSHKQKQWSRWLHWAEYWYNTSYQTSTRMTPFEAVYGRPPPSVHCYERGSIAVAYVEDTLLARDVILRILKDNLVLAQNRQKVQADRHRREQEFVVDDWVYLKLQPFRQMSVRTRSNMKLSPRFYGPYRVLEKIGSVAYKVELPTGSRIHPVFHVSQLKQKLGAVDFVVDELPAITEDGAMVVEPKWILEVRWTRVGRKTVQEVLVHWTGLRRENATWERLSDLEMQFPHLNLEDKIRLQGEGNVMTVATKKNEEVDGHARCADVADSVQDVADSVHEANENTLKSCG